MLTAAFLSGFAALAAALGAAERPQRSSAEPAPAEFDFYALDVAFTPHGPEILSFWMPATVAITADEGPKTGDLK
jgi:hypothetical protein